MAISVFQQTEHCLAITSAEEKCAAVDSLWHSIQDQDLNLDSDYPLQPIGQPGRPEAPELVAPTAVPRRRLGSEQGRAALIHAIAHIEFNAINLALDAAYRFRDLPEAYYRDWISVARDEARHFQMLTQRLEALGYHYGDFPAHNGLWEMAVKTADDGMKRMALVPRVLEARGLDVTPGMIERLQGAGDHETVAVLEVILREEVRHVEIGSRWFQWYCDQRELPAEATFIELLKGYYDGQIKPPFNHQARLVAGFSEQEIKALKAL